MKNRSFLGVFVGFCLACGMAISVARCSGKRPAKPPGVMEESPYTEGQRLYDTHCASCHLIERRLVGPALAGAEARWQGRVDEMTAYINNPPQYRYTNRPQAAYVRALHAAGDGREMPPIALKEAQVRAILDFVRAQERAAE